MKKSSGDAPALLLHTKLAPKSTSRLNFTGALINGATRFAPVDFTGFHVQ